MSICVWAKMSARAHIGVLLRCLSLRSEARASLLQIYAFSFSARPARARGVFGQILLQVHKFSVCPRQLRQLRDGGANSPAMALTQSLEIAGEAAVKAEVSE